MVTSDIDEEKPPSVEEMYSTAVGSSNLRVEGDRRNVADMVIAAGMNPHRLGLALRRLATEWDAVGKPPPPDERNIEAMAAKYPRIPGTGLVLVSRIEDNGDFSSEQLLPLVAAKREADQWYAHELGLLFQRLKTLPAVRSALMFEAQSWSLEGAEHVVAAVLQWWLQPRCPACKGVKKKVVLGTGRTSSKDCRTCKGSGEAKVPHGSVGRKLQRYIQGCERASASGLRGKFRHHVQAGFECKEV
jgi:hypothetical protein